MSASPPKADMLSVGIEVRFVPKADLYHARLNKNLNEYPRLR